MKIKKSNNREKSTSALHGKLRKSRLTWKRGVRLRRGAIYRALLIGRNKLRPYINAGSGVEN